MARPRQWFGCAIGAEDNLTAPTGANDDGSGDAGTTISFYPLAGMDGNRHQHRYLLVWPYACTLGLRNLAK